MKVVHPANGDRAKLWGDGMKLKYEMEVLEIDGCPMAVPVDGGDEFRGVLHMNGTTRDILDLLKDDTTEDEVVAALAREYDATEDELRRSVRKVAGILHEYGLLIED